MPRYKLLYPPTFQVLGDAYNLVGRDHTIRGLIAYYRLHHDYDPVRAAKRVLEGVNGRWTKRSSMETLEGQLTYCIINRVNYFQR